MSCHSHTLFSTFKLAFQAHRKPVGVAKLTQKRAGAFTLLPSSRPTVFLVAVSRVLSPLTPRRVDLGVCVHTAA